MCYVIAKSLDPEDPLACQEDTLIAYLSGIDRDGFTFSSMEYAICFTKSFAFSLKEYISSEYGDQLECPLFVMEDIYE